MGDITTTENKFLNELVKDCVLYRLTEQEALEYIKFRYKAISLSAYKLRKGKVSSEQSTEIWMNHFTRVGFVTHHKEQIDIIQTIQNDSLKQLHIERNKEDRNEAIIFRLKDDIRENAKVLSEFSLGTPIIAAIKKKLEESDQIQKRNYYYNSEK